ncbi:hypothetical protein MPTK1_3g24940 [Marchantia polymorpha subsp. ruderalis]|uniref:Uncharacterized protein n=2 Tax=Marchantia polymorpha TaxID=3197 RepID=A0AAF6B4I1_MARPO|nr:hypothetical protein MARPO_0100s0007 [Marchantia polymorpha]BBN06915.1 hypothetical protein Mp_3g24940 [Marchantia polymorpha subsp. ruderalis]|eukprot:PTQ32292.1 hypothetical protein MARPO_0100s0007 [Marchantia polymorpha]
MTTSLPDIASGGGGWWYASTFIAARKHVSRASEASECPSRAGNATSDGSKFTPASIERDVDLAPQPPDRGPSEIGRRHSRFRDSVQDDNSVNLHRKAKSPTLRLRSLGQRNEPRTVMPSLDIVGGDFSSKKSEVLAATRLRSTEVRRTEQNRTEQDSRKQNRAEQNRTERNRVDLSSACERRGEEYQGPSPGPERHAMTQKAKSCLPNGRRDERRRGLGEGHGETGRAWKRASDSSACACRQAGRQAAMVWPDRPRSDASPKYRMLEVHVQDGTQTSIFSAL